MFVYCGNNPVVRVDPSGRGWVAVVIGMVVGAGIGVATSWIGSAVTGQEFTWLDAGIAAISGGISSFGVPGLIFGSIINGAYSAYTAYEDGANLYGSLGSGIISGLLNMVSFGDLAQAGDDLVGVAISAFTDFVFGTGFSSMDAALSNTLIENNPRMNPFESKRKRSALEVAMQVRKISMTRIYNGEIIIVNPKRRYIPRESYNDPNKLYCYVQL